MVPSEARLAREESLTIAIVRKRLAQPESPLDEHSEPTGNQRFRVGFVGSA